MKETEVVPFTVKNIIKEVKTLQAVTVWEERDRGGHGVKFLGGREGKREREGAGSGEKEKREGKRKKLSLMEAKL